MTTVAIVPTSDTTGEKSYRAITGDNSPVEKNDSGDRHKFSLLRLSLNGRFLRLPFG